MSERGKSYRLFDTVCYGEETAYIVTVRRLDLLRRNLPAHRFGYTREQMLAQMATNLIVTA